MTSTSGSQVLAHVLARMGIGAVFMVPTVAVRSLAEMEHAGIRVVSAHSEKAAAYMADGYSRASGRVGVCMAQAVGATNMLAGLRDAALSRTPLLAITGGPSSTNVQRGNYQETLDFPAFSTVTLSSQRVENVDDFGRQLLRSLDLAARVHMPVHLELAGPLGQILDTQLRVAELPDVPDRLVKDARKSLLYPDPNDISQAMTFFRGAQRPLIVAGAGARAGLAGQALRELLDTTGMPLVTSLAGKGVVDERHPNVVGALGASSHRAANQLAERCDVALFVGTQMDSQLTDNWRLPGVNCKIIHLDRDPIVLGRGYVHALTIQSDARTGLAALLAELREFSAPRTWQSEVAQVKAHGDAHHFASLVQSSERLSPGQIFAVLSAESRAKTDFVVDTGHTGIWAAAYLRVSIDQRVFPCSGSLGWALPGAIGASSASSNRRTVAIMGDAGFFYHLSEIETAVRHDIPALFIINNNFGMSQDKKIFERSWGGSDQISAEGNRLWQFESVSVAEVARGLGAKAVMVDSLHALVHAVRTGLSGTTINVIEVVTDRNHLPEPPYGGADFYAA